MTTSRQPAEKAEACSQCGPGYRIGDEGCRHTSKSGCICPRTDGYRIKRRGCPAHTEADAAHWRERDRRKFGTDAPHEPTSEFVVQAFAEGARSLWPDSRDPGWHVTFQRWLAARDARIVAEALREAATALGHIYQADSAGATACIRSLRERADALSLPSARPSGANDGE